MLPSFGSEIYFNHAQIKFPAYNARTFLGFPLFELWHPSRNISANVCNVHRYVYASLWRTCHCFHSGHLTSHLTRLAPSQCSSSVHFLFPSVFLQMGNRQISQKKWLDVHHEKCKPIKDICTCLLTFHSKPFHLR